MEMEEKRGWREEGGGRSYQIEGFCLWVRKKIKEKTEKLRKIDQKINRDNASICFYAAFFGYEERGLLR